MGGFDSDIELALELRIFICLLCVCVVGWRVYKGGRRIKIRKEYTYKEGYVPVW